MMKLLSIIFFGLLLYRLITNSGHFLGSSDKSDKDPEYIDYEEIDSKLKE